MVGGRSGCAGIDLLRPVDAERARAQSLARHAHDRDRRAHRYGFRDGMPGVAIAVVAAEPVDHAHGDRHPAGRPRSCDVAAVRLPAPRHPVRGFRVVRDQGPARRPCHGGAAARDTGDLGQALLLDHEQE